jgi:hypothetical protein
MRAWRPVSLHQHHLRSVRETQRVHATLEGHCPGTLQLHEYSTAAVTDLLLSGAGHINRRLPDTTQMMRSCCNICLATKVHNNGLLAHMQHWSWRRQCFL